MIAWRCRVENDRVSIECKITRFKKPGNVTGKRLNAVVVLKHRAVFHCFGSQTLRSGTLFRRIYRNPAKSINLDRNLFFLQISKDSLAFYRRVCITTTTVKFSVVTSMLLYHQNTVNPDFSSPIQSRLFSYPTVSTSYKLGNFKRCNLRSKQISKILLAKSRI